MKCSIYLIGEDISGFSAGGLSIFNGESDCLRIGNSLLFDGQQECRLRKLELLISFITSEILDIWLICSGDNSGC